MTLSVRNVSKTYPNGVKALRSINLELQPGMFGLLGPNGAGKSSLMRTIATLQRPDEGNVFFADKDIFQHTVFFRQRLGFLPQDFGVYPGEKAINLLHYFARLKGIAGKKDRDYAVDRVLELTNLSEAARRPVSSFSGGMKQRFGIAQLLLNDPKVIITDEPTAGLDPAERTRFLNVLRGVGTENIVIFSTHLVEDISALCRESVIIDHGEILTRFSPQTAAAELRGKVWEIPSEAVTEVPFTKLSERYTDGNEVLLRIFAERCPLPGLQPAEPKTEDFYFYTLNRQNHA